MQTEFAEAAVRYARLGLAVIPLKPGQKRPMFENWTNIERANEELVTRWWAQNENANVGVLTGEKSSCFVLDVDTKNGGDETFESLVHQHGKFPPTWQQITGTGGWHLFFRYPNFRVGNSAGIFPGIDIRGTGGQVVVPPSIHPDTGRRYEWDGLEEIENIPMAEAPLWVLEILQGKHDQKKPYLSMPVQIRHGVQHQTLVSFAGMMRRLGLDAEEILPSLMKVNERRCERPGSAENINAIAQSMMKYRPSDGDLLSTATRLWRVTKAKEHEAQEKADSLIAPSVDGLTVYRSPALDNKCVIENLLLNGLTIFAGRPKSGKSWLALQMALAVSMGVPFMASRDVVTPGRVLYLALEESQQRTSTRMKKLLLAESVMLQNVSMVYSLLPLMGGGAEQLKAMIEKYSPTLVIIDSLLSVVGAAGKKHDPMRSDYQEINTLHKISEDAKTAIVLIDHTRKRGVGSGGGLDEVSGTSGRTAAADAIWVIAKQDGGFTMLEIQGRDIEDQTLALKFTKEPIDFGWSIIGDGDSVKRAANEEQIRLLLSSLGKLTASSVANRLRINPNLIIKLMEGMRTAGTLSYDGHGGYYLPGNPKKAGGYDHDD